MGLINSNFGTAVGNGKTCTSACALVFMSGGLTDQEGEGTVSVDRILHPLARLGFHVPALPQQNVERYSASVIRQFAQDFYTAELANIGLLLSISDYVYFPQTLMTEMLKTPPSKFFYVDTVAKAARWFIVVAPVVEPKKFSESVMVNTCSNLVQRLADTSRGLAFAVGGDSGAISVGQENGMLIVKLSGYGAEAMSDCVLSVPENSQANGIRKNEFEMGDISIDGWGASDLYQFMSFSGNLKISQLARKNDKIPEKIDPNTLVESWQTRTMGECYIFVGNKMNRRARCQEISNHKVKNGSQTSVISEYMDNDNLMATKENINGNLTINGGRTETISNISFSDNKVPNKVSKQICSLSSYPESAYCNFNCWLNQQTNSRFCFFDYSYFNERMIVWQPDAE